jgi:hypothetical protein
LSKSIPTPKAKPKFLSKAQERKFSTFFKVRLPKMQSKDLGELESEVVASFQTLAGLLWGIDPQLLIYPWVNSTANRPLKKGGQTPKHRDGLKIYADNVYLEQYKSPWLKLRVGHTTDEESFDGEEFRAALMRSDMNFYKEKLQTKFTCRTGWLLGTHNMAFNARNLEAAIEQLPEFKEIPIEVRMEPIRTKRGSAKKPASRAKDDKAAAFIWAAHVWTSWEKSAVCRKALSDLYSSRNKEGFPLGIQARFVPYTLDSRFITTPKTAQNVERMKSKQKRFNDRTSTARNFTIIGLDYECPDLGVTLREVLMGLRSSSQPERNLFVAVDQMTNYSSVVMAFHEDLEQEATTVIPALPIILEAKLGPSAWTWFNEEAKEYSAGYRWDKTVGLVSIEDERTDEILAEWSSEEELEDGETEDIPVARIEAFDIVLNQPGKNQYNDNYSIGTFKTACDPKTKTGPKSPASSLASTTSTAPSSVETTSIISPSTSTLSNESPREELFNHWCQDDQFRIQAMEWLAKNMTLQETKTPPKDATEETNTGGEKNG